MDRGGLGLIGREIGVAASGSCEQAAQLRKPDSGLRAKKHPGRLLAVDFESIMHL